MGARPFLPAKARRFRDASIPWLVALVLALLLSACGGGGDGAAFNVAVVIDGQPTGSRYGVGSTSTIVVHAGQSFELDASEPVYWTLFVADTAVSGSGTVVHYAGADITLTEESDSRIAIDTYAAGPLFGTIPLTFVATSTIDAAEVATVNVLLTD